MAKYICLGTAPQMERSCLENEEGQVRAFIDLLRRAVCPEPTGVRLDMAYQVHFGGEHATVVCFYDERDDRARRCALRYLSERPTHWDRALRTAREEAV